MVLEEFSAYAPWLPSLISVHEKFGKEVVFVLDGLVADSVSNIPTVTFTDKLGTQLLVLKIDVVSSTLKIFSDLKPGVTEYEVSVDVGEPFSLSLAYDSKNLKFEPSFNHDKLDKYALNDPNLNFHQIKTDGDLSVNYVGFVEAGQSPAVPVGTVLYFGCPDEWVFGHDWYQRPQIQITCMESGLFDEPEAWPFCVNREASKKSNPIRIKTNFSCVIFSNNYNHTM